MRPYLAVIKDSFREAFASWVLWIVLILILLFLLLIAPFNYHIVPQVRLFPGDIRAPLRFVEDLVDARGSNDTPAGYVAGLLTNNLNDRLQELAEIRTVDEDSLTREEAEELIRSSRDTLRDLYLALNNLLYSRSFYDEAVWSDVPLNSEAQALLDEGLDNLGDQEVARLNRLAFDAAFEGYVEPADREAVAIGYLHWELLDEVPLAEKRLQDLVSGALTWVVNLLVGVFGIIIALVVTSFIVPRMLDTGAVDLLLSKPVSRPLLLLSKFLGGCAFILLCTAFLNTGAWLIIGLRFGVWNSGLLWAILVFVFVFAIYYSVSTAAAMLWRSAIVSIICAVLFWGVCFSVGFFKGYLEKWWLDTQRTAAIIPTDDGLLVTNWEGVAKIWNSASSRFVDVFETPRKAPAAMEGYPFLGPLYDAENDRLVTVRIPSPGTWPPEPNLLLVAKPEDDWAPSAGEVIPFDAQVLLLDSDGSSIIGGLDGIYRFSGDPTINLQDFDLDIDAPEEENALVRIDDDSGSWRRPFDVAIDPQEERMAIISGDEVLVLEPNDESTFDVVDSRERENSAKAVVGISGDMVLIAQEGGVIRILNRATLNQKDEFQSDGDEPRGVVASPDGRWLAVQFYNRVVWLYDVENSAPADAPLRGQGDISAVTFGSDNTFYASDRFGRVIQYRPGDGFSEVNRWSPEAGSLESFYRWFVLPVYTVCPKPGEMDNLINWLMTRQGTSAEDEDQDDNDLGFGPAREVQRSVPNIWQPLWSNLAFLAVMLTLTSVYFTRKEF